MKLSIRTLSADDRPREKFEAHGAQALSKAELLAILIGSGTADENAVQLMQRVMGDCEDSLAALGRMSIDDLCQYKGVGPAKAITLLAACELGKRRLAEKGDHRVFDSAQAIYDHFYARMRDTPTEESHVLLLNQRLGFVGSRLISRGGLTGTVVDVRRVLREALVSGATQIALCHNHPSGLARPSREDDALTERLARAAKTVDIGLVDHIIVTDDGFYSYHDEGRL